MPTHTRKNGNDSSVETIAKGEVEACKPVSRIIVIPTKGRRGSVTKSIACRPLEVVVGPRSKLQTASCVGTDKDQEMTKEDK